MPSRSLKQTLAMRVGCAGKGKLGIPRKVACEYVKADRKRARRGNPLKYRMIDPPVKVKRSYGVDLKVMGVLALIAVGIYFAQSAAAGE